MPSLCMILSQVGAIFLVSWILGSVGIISTTISMFVSAVLCFCGLGYSRTDWPVRTDILRLSRNMFVSMWVLGVLMYTICFFIFPEAFDFETEKLWLIAPFVGLAPGFISLIMTLCAGDTALLILGREGEDS